MAELVESISEEKIKVRWSETYVSEAMNRKLAMLPPGIYSGGDVDYDSTTELRIWGGDFVLSDVVSGFSLMVQDTDQTIIDCSSLFPAVGDQTWYVGVRTDYATGVDTTGEYFFTDTPPSANQLIGRDGLVYYEVEIHDSDTGLNQATFTDMFGSAKPTPYPLRATEGAVLSTDRDLGFITNVQAYGLPTSDEKDALDGAASPSSTNVFATMDDSPTSDEKDAMSGANSPSSTNVFATMDDSPTSDEKDALDGAASPSSTNVFATMDDIVNIPTEDEKDALDGANSPSATNVFITSDDMLTSDQKDAIDGAESPSATNVFVTDSYLPYDFENYLQIFDHFVNRNISFTSDMGVWDEASSGVGSVGYSAVNNNGALRMYSGDSSDWQELFASVATESNVSKNPYISAKILLEAITDIVFIFGLYYDSDNYIIFKIDTSVAAGFRVESKSGGTLTWNTHGGMDTPDTDWHKFEIIVTGDGASVTFKYDDVVMGTHTTNIPTVDCRRYFYLHPLGASSRYVNIDWFYLKQELE